ncbi:MAG: C10 family peptidase, partial [Draconibacterium sp.]|nr:C10 family peptidase [Draconibacterium sp.]
MKHLLLFLFLLVGVASSSLAKRVELKTAQLVAQNMYKSVTKLKSANSIKLELVYITEQKTISNTGGLKTAEIPLIYIFNVENEHGFIIVSGDDNVSPILGYSTEGYIDNSNLPPNFIAWIEDYKTQIESVVKNKIIATDEINTKWEILRDGLQLKSYTEVSSVDPLISANWGQATGWNEYCPSDVDGPGGHALVGCVAVAMGQILNKWGHPIQGIGSHSYTHPDYGTISADFGNTIYNWSSMSDNTADQNSAILLYHCGVAVNMDYGAASSGAYSYLARNAIINYFNYSTDAEYIYKSNYSVTAWKDILVNELNNNRPVYYSGRNDSSGHAFVCDGYQNSDYFHFNWGWDGYQNGYFYLDDLTPSSRSYNDSQEAIIGIHPNTTTTSVEVEYSDYYIDDDTSGSSNGDDDGKAEAAETIELSVELYNSGSSTANNVECVLSTSDSDITITDNYESWGDINAGTRSWTSGFNFVVSSSCPAKDIIFTLAITSDEGNWNKTFAVHIYCDEP